MLEKKVTDGDAGFKDKLAAVVPNLRAFALGLTRNADRADDLVQETLIRAWRHRKTFQSGTNMKAWLFAILRNVHVSEIRKRRREVEDIDGAAAASLTVDGGQEGHLDLLEFGEALSRLPLEQREALLLIGAEGFSYEEAALMCGCAVGTMKSRVNRARVRLSELLGLDELRAG